MIDYFPETIPSIPLIDAVHNNQKLVMDTCHRLEYLAGAFYRTGNIQVADEILSYLQPLIDSAKQVVASYSIDLNKQVSHGESMLGGLLMVGLKMCELEDKAKVHD